MTQSAGATPRISLGLPVYNGQNFLAECIESLLAQTYTDFELIISDNASTDQTHAICEHYASRDARIRYHRCPANQGASPNFNRLVDMARGTYFKWAAHDDRCHPDFLARCAAALDETPTAILCYPATHVINEGGEIMSEYRDGLHLAEGSPHERLAAYLRINFMRLRGLCNPVFGLMRIEHLRRTRLLQDFPGSDRLLLAHLAMLGGFVELPEVLFQHRLHAGVSTMAAPSFAGRRQWFNNKAGKKQRTLLRFDNHLALRIHHIYDLYRSISELIDDRDERLRCRMALTKLLMSDIKWIYIDIKYSLGFHPKPQKILQSFRQS